MLAHLLQLIQPFRERTPPQSSLAIDPEWQALFTASQKARRHHAERKPIQAALYNRTHQLWSGGR